MTDELGAVIHRSMERAAQHTRRVFAADPLWSGADVENFVNSTGSATVATVGASGWPHTAWVPAGCLDGRFCVVASHESVLLRNLSSSSRVAVTVVGDGAAMLGQGYAERAPHSEALDELFARLSADDASWRTSYALIAVRFTRLFAS